MRLQREGDQERRTARSKPPLESSLQTRAQLVDDLETVPRLNIHGVLIQLIWRERQRPIKMTTATWIAKIARTIRLITSVAMA
jgi:hypothetical protein